mgnify:CR=1 FL=1
MAHRILLSKETHHKELKNEYPEKDFKERKPALKEKKPILTRSLFRGSVAIVECNEYDGVRIPSTSMKLNLEIVPDLEEISSLASKTENLDVCNRILPVRLRKLVMRYTSLVFDIVNNRVRDELKKSTDYYLFANMFNVKMEVLKSLASRRVLEYVVRKPEYLCKNLLVRYMMSRCLCFIAAQALLLQDRVMVGSRNGRFVYQYYVDKLSDYFYKFGKYGKDVIVWPDYILENYTEVRELSGRIHTSLRFALSYSFNEHYYNFNFNRDPVIEDGSSC